jgi:hypothetical protein
VFYADADLDADSRETGQPLCLHCLVDDSDEQLAAGLDMAKVHSQADWDLEGGEWFAPADHWKDCE